MNFLGHAVIASENSEDPRFVLGAMLPDLTAMAGGRLRGVDHTKVALGVRHHHETDSVFHATPSFGRLVTTTTQDLQERGLRRGPARAVGHVGIELLLDGWWVRHHGIPVSYTHALQTAPSVEATLRWRSPVPDGLLSQACRRLLELDVAAGYAEPVRVAQRLTRVLSPRPRLALQREEQRIVEEWASESGATIGVCAPTLFDEVRSGLARR